VTSQLLPHHRDQLERESGISPEVLAESGVRSVAESAELRTLGFAEYQRMVPGILFPYKTLGGLTRYRYRPDNPRLNDRGKPVKYEAPAGVPLSLYVPPKLLPLMANPKVDMDITEGEKKSLAGYSNGRVSVSLPGVWGFRGTNPFGGKTALPDWESVALNGRTVRVIFDSDVTVKPEVQLALARLVAFLESRGAKVRIVYLPDGPNGEKVGMDEYLLTHTSDELDAIPPGIRPTDGDRPWERCDCGCQEIIEQQAEVIRTERERVDLVTEQVHHNAAALGLVHTIVSDPDKPMGARLAMLSVWLEDRANPTRSWDYQPDLAAKVGIKSVSTFRANVAPFIAGPDNPAAPIVKISDYERVPDSTAPNGERVVQRVRYGLCSDDDGDVLSAYLRVVVAPKERKQSESVDRKNCGHLEIITGHAEVDRCEACTKVLEIRPTQCAENHRVGDDPVSSPDPSPVRTPYAPKLGACADAPPPRSPNSYGAAFRPAYFCVSADCRAPLEEGRHYDCGPCMEAFYQANPHARPSAQAGAA
jgi:hypothetical protein